MSKILDWLTLWSAVDTWDEKHYEKFEKKNVTIASIPVHGYRIVFSTNFYSIDPITFSYHTSEVERIMGTPFLRSEELTPEKFLPNSLIVQASQMTFRIQNTRILQNSFVLARPKPHKIRSQETWVWASASIIIVTWLWEKSLYCESLLAQTQTRSTVKDWDIAVGKKTSLFLH